MYIKVKFKCNNISNKILRGLLYIPNMMSRPNKGLKCRDIYIYIYIYICISVTSITTPYASFLGSIFWIMNLNSSVDLLKYDNNCTRDSIKCEYKELSKMWKKVLLAYTYIFLENLRAQFTSES